MSINFKSFNSVLDAVSQLLDLPTPPTPPLPPPAILATASRQGLSPSKIASRIVSRRAEAGIPTGALPSGDANPAELMEKIRIEEIIKALQQEARIQVAIQPGIPTTAAGANAGGPVVTAGSTVLFGQGNGVIS